MSSHLESKMFPAVKLLALLTGELLRPSFLYIPLPFLESKEKKIRKIKEDQIEILNQLTAKNVDPVMFDSLLSRELDRSLKSSYGNVFVILTVMFTIISYAIVVLNSIFQWGIPDIAITALIIEVPLQFIGLLYIIAKNLFPSSGQ